MVGLVYASRVGKGWGPRAGFGVDRQGGLQLLPISSLQCPDQCIQLGHQNIANWKSLCRVSGSRAAPMEAQSSHRPCAVPSEKSHRRASTAIPKSIRLQLSKRASIFSRCPQQRCSLPSVGPHLTLGSTPPLPGAIPGLEGLEPVNIPRRTHLGLRTPSLLRFRKVQNAS